MRARSEGKTGKKDKVVNYSIQLNHNSNKKIEARKNLLK